MSSGVERLDAMLGSGYFRGSSVLITGSAGTGKTILAGTFAEAACLRKERTFYVSFDENPSEVVRDLSSVGIRLGPHLKSGVLRMHSARTEASSAEVHLMKIKSIVREHRSRCMVVDPLSAIVKAGAALTAGRVAERLICLAKSEGITLVSTSLLQGAQPLTEETPTPTLTKLSPAPVRKIIGLAYFCQSRGCFASLATEKGPSPTSSKASTVIKSSGIRGAYSAFVRLPTRIDERPQLDWSGSSCEIGGSCRCQLGGNPIELHLLFVPECELTGSRGHRGEQAPIAFLPIRGSSATQLFSKKITNKGMSVKFPRVVRVPARSLAHFHRERSVRYSAGLNTVKDSVRPGTASGFCRDLRGCLKSLTQGRSGLA